MPFQESARSTKAKMHLSAVKTPVLIGVCAVAAVVAIVVLQGFWSTLGGGFEVIRTEGSATGPAPSSEVDKADDAAEVTGSSAQSPLVAVHVGGAVMAPGVYELPEGSRAKAAIDAAGGVREDASSESVNLARVVFDGEQIIVPTLEEAQTHMPVGEQGQMTAGGKVDINRASLSELTGLPGIGEATARKIIAERESKGPFTSPEDIMRVSGIGQKKYESLADLICV